MPTGTLIDYFTGTKKAVPLSTRQVPETFDMFLKHSHHVDTVTTAGFSES